MAKNENRSRNIQLKIWVSEEEKTLILAKMRYCGYRSLAAYLRQAAVYEKIVLYDFKDEIEKTNKELNSIGVNIHQIAARVNSTGRIYAEDIDFLKEKVGEIWQLQKYILSRIR